MHARRATIIERIAIAAILSTGLAAAQNHPESAPLRSNSAAILRNNEAVRLSSEGREKAAEELYQAALKAAVNDDLICAKIATNLGTLYQRQDRYPEAERMFRYALQLRQKNLSAGNIEVAYALNNLADIYRVEGRDWDARKLMETALHNLQEFHSDDPGLPIVLSNLALVLCRFNQFDRAEELLRSAMIAYEKHGETDGRGYGIALSNLGDVLASTGDFDAAQSSYKPAIVLFEHMGESGRTDLAATLASAGAVDQRQGRLFEAEETERRALRLLHPGGDTLLRAQILRHLGNIVAAGHAPDSLHYFEQSLAIEQQILGSEDPNTAAVLLDYSSASLRAGNKSLARKLRKRAMDLLSRIGSHSPAQMTVSLRDLQNAQNNR